DLPMAYTWLKFGAPFPIIRRLVIRRSAEWLKWFHSATENKMLSFRDSLDIDRLTADLSVVAETRRALEFGSTSQWSLQISAGVASCSPCGVPHARLHGDFWQKNILLSRKR